MVDKEHPVKRILADIGVSQQDVADSLGISQPLCCIYLNGRRPVPEHINQKLTRIAEYLKSNKISRPLDGLQL